MSLKESLTRWRWNLPRSRPRSSTLTLSSFLSISDEDRNGELRQKHATVITCENAAQNAVAARAADREVYAAEVLEEPMAHARGFLALAASGALHLPEMRKQALLCLTP